MSTWDSYIDNLIEQSKDKSGQAHVDKVCIIGLDGGGSWTSDKHPRALKLMSNEAKTIAECFKKKDFTSFIVSGVHVEGEYYIFLREIESKAVYAFICKEGLQFWSNSTSKQECSCCSTHRRGNAARKCKQSCWSNCRLSWEYEPLRLVIVAKYSTNKLQVPLAN